MMRMGNALHATSLAGIWPSNDSMLARVIQDLPRFLFLFKCERMLRSLRQVSRSFRLVLFAHKTKHMPMRSAWEPRK